VSLVPIASVSEHIHNVIRFYSEILHALRILRMYGTTRTLYTVAVVMRQLPYASMAWWGFTSEDDRQHLDGFIPCKIRQDYCASDLDFAWHNPSSRWEAVLVGLKKTVNQSKPWFILAAHW